MKIFISSLISGMTEPRLAARQAVESLGHTAVMAEDFQPSPQSPQIACLSGLRSSAAVVLILNDQYGAKQSSGLSPTHEEYREAKGRQPVFVFRQEVHSNDPDQAAFIAEAEGWESGEFRGTFKSPEELKTKITRALHEWEVSRASSPLDSDALLVQAKAQIPDESRGFSQSGVSVLVSIAGGPTQAILRPSEIESADLSSEIMKEALFGKRPLFDPKRGSDSEINDHALVVFQDDHSSFVRVTGQGDILIKLPLATTRGNFVVIEEMAAAGIQRALEYGSWLLDHLDPTNRLSHVAVAVALRGSDAVVWRTQDEHRQSPDSYSFGHHQRDPKPVYLSPPHRTRAALAMGAEPLATDLITLLRRQVKG